MLRLGNLVAAGLTALAGALPAQGLNRELHLTENLRVGTLDGVGRLGGVQSFASDGAGGFVVSDIVFRELRLYDGSGRMVWSRPIPPCQGYVGVALDRDTIAVLDEGRETRLLVLTSTKGEAVDAMPLDHEAGTQWRLLGGRAGNWMLLHTRSHRLVGRRLEPLERVTYSGLRATPPTARLDTVSLFIDSSASVTLSEGGGFSRRVRPPFWQAPVFAADDQTLITMAGGAGAVVLSPITTGPSDTFFVGMPVDSITDSDRDRLLANMIAASPGDSNRRREVESMRKLPGPATFPIGRAIFASPDSAFAVLRYRQQDGSASTPQRLDLFHGRGAHIGHVMIPGGEQVVGFDGRHVFVVRTDRTRVSATVERRPRPLQHVVRYRIER